MSAQPLMVARSAGSLWATRQTVAQSLSVITGSAKHRSPYTRTSPTRVLALRLQRKHPEQRKKYGSLFRTAARLTNERLPTMTFQRLLRKEDLQDERGLSDIVSQSNPDIWRDRLNSLATKGWQEADIDHWVWILSAESADACIQRFASTDIPKPFFVLAVLLQSGQTLQSPDSLRLVLEYISKYCCAPEPNSATDGEVLRKYPRTSLLVPNFLILLRRLVRHVRRTWPRSIVTLAELTRNYIKNLHSNDKYGSVYHQRCKVFNVALQLFAGPASHQPLLHMDFNWRAQRLLLSMSDGMARPLIIEKMSYRAIRKVLVGQRKSAAEKAVATRYAKSWPPYRQDFDGHDARRTLHDDQSRSVKAGVLMTEAGYVEDDYDRALSVLGGVSGQTPTIQTRSLAPKAWKDEKERDNFYVVWAMKVRSTRNSQEAWRAFSSFTDVEPTLQVYTEMFMKLQARGVNPSQESLPGDSREVLPVHHGNFSEYELARLTPPTVSELYQHMLSRGVRPEGICLQNLISNAQSIEEGMHYLRDSAIDPMAVAQLNLVKANNYPLLRRVPLLVFKSHIQLLCRLQPNLRGSQSLSHDELYRIRQAIQLCKIRFPTDTPEGVTFRPGWHAIFRALARPYVALINGEQIDNDVEALEMSLHVYETVEQTIGVDPEIFIYLCRTIQKVAVSHLDLYDVTSMDHAKSQSPAHLMQGNTRLGGLYRYSLRTLQVMFAKMTSEVSQPRADLKLPRFMHFVTPVQLHSYMRTLAFMEDVHGMVDLLDWILTHKDFVDEEADRTGNRGLLMIAKTLCAFEAFAGPHLDPDLRDELDMKMERITEADPSWRWPSSEDIESYIHSDRRGGSQKLQQKTIAAWWQQAPELDRQERDQQAQAG